MKGNQSAYVRLFVVSFLILFAEVMLIRWLGIELAVIRVFPNLILTTIFIGSSIGLATYKSPLPSTPVLSIAAVVPLLLLIFAPELGLRFLTLSEKTVECLLLIGFVLVDLTVVFISLGRLLGREFESGPPLTAYAVNLFGSMAGVIAFGFISWLWLPPPVWLAVCAVAVWLLSKRRAVFVVGAALALVSACAQGGNTWSPYSKIAIVPLHGLDRTVLGEGNYNLVSNNEFFHTGMRVVPLSAERRGRYRPMEPWRRDYREFIELPYKLSSAHERVLVLGSGSGTDVSLALMKGAALVDAVEIDPYIASCGFERHPDKPYLNPRVHVHVEDARAFARRAPKGAYDLIQFAYLDPGATLKLSSFLRLDNFVYTRESMESALKLLNDRGIISLSFATGADAPVTRRLYAIITAAYGKPPLAVVQESTGSCCFFFGPGLRQPTAEMLREANLRLWPRSGEYRQTKASTDDWPFLFLEFTWGAVALYLFVLTVAAAGPLLILRRGISGRAPLREVLPMLLLGQAFMLVETKSITQLSLLFGATWVVSSVVILVILVLASAANWLAGRLKLSSTFPLYFGLLCALLLDYAVRMPESLGVPSWAVPAILVLVSCLPVFFGGMIFSTLLKDAANPVLMLAANVLGVACGGLLENLCMVVGIKSLSLVALFLYGLSMLPQLGRSKRGPLSEKSATNGEQSGVEEE